MRGNSPVLQQLPPVPETADPMDSEPRMAWAEPALRPAVDLLTK